jgi:hypothetical protein
MARPGYVAVRKALYDAEQSVAAAEAELAALEAEEITVGWTQETFEETKAARRANMMKYLEQYRTQLAQAQRAMEPFEPAKPVKRTYYDFRIQIHLSVDKPLADAIAEKRAKGFSLAEIVRTALVAHLLPGSCPPGSGD